MSSAPDGGFTMTNASLGLLLGQAFPQSTRDMSGLPSWTSSERFDVTAKGPVGAKPNPEQRAGMLRAMLVDRFKLKTHVEAREQPAYDLVLARSDGKLGPNLTPSDFDCGTVAAAAAAARETGAPPPPLPTLAGGIPACTQRALGKRFDGHMTIATLAAGALRGMTDRVVVDKTGLNGFFIVVLDAPPSPDPQRQTDGPSVFAAVQEQLGLRLVPSRTMVDVLVIDSVERPSEN